MVLTQFHLLCDVQSQSKPIISEQNSSLIPSPCMSKIGKLFSMRSSLGFLTVFPKPLAIKSRTTGCCKDVNCSTGRIFFKT
eukprot:TRINITY_DN4295_c0_g1_i1.p1 TRINITY_DN4295_c0_g1~~TRINITY_DN4295_c0_g1_i1.p1  ORF type:complete len:81 (+),score=3.74 TRINITY_DN4295_c0_g1_i1:133-375(+)